MSPQQRTSPDGHARQEATDSHPSGGHCCLTYSEPERPWKSIVSFMGKGLARNRRLLYLHGGDDREAVVRALRAAGVNVDALRFSGQLRLQATERHFLCRDGTLDPRRPVEEFLVALADVLRDGFHGLQVVAEAAWAAERDVPADVLTAYEKRMGDVLDQEAADLLCLYAAEHFRRPVIDAIGPVHREPRSASGFPL